MYHAFAFNKQDIRFTPSITESTIEFLVVGGGGAGGFRTGGGGGGGGYVTTNIESGGGQAPVSGFILMNTPYQISVGAGGNAFTTALPSGNTGNGSNSRLKDAFAHGGGRGGSGNTDSNVPPSTSIDGQSGGSGGGGGQWNNFGSTYATGSGGTGSSGQTTGEPPVPSGTIYGYNGGSGSVGANFQRGGGGGGAGAVGQNAVIGASSATVGANGGDGLFYGPTTGQELPYRAGGGGGGHSISPGTPSTTALGGAGGGGNGGKSGVFPGPGEELKGGGGGGGGVSSWVIGGKGGSGIVILKYLASEITASVTPGVTASETQTSGYKILTVTAALNDEITFTALI